MGIELMSMPEREILQMTEEEVLTLMNRATGRRVFTDGTWAFLNDRLDYFRQARAYEPTRLRIQEIPNRRSDDQDEQLTGFYGARRNDTTGNVHEDRRSEEDLPFDALGVHARAGVETTKMGLFAGPNLLVNSVGMEFVLVRSGNFDMGSNDFACGKPIHTVTISTPFYIGRFQTTQGQWERIMGNNPSDFKGIHRPVDSVSWNAAQDFIRRLNKKENTHKYRLPTEAEWEFAARGGIQSGGFKFSGSDSVGAVAVFDESSGRKTKPVGSKKPNELGIYDMSGNVWEWCDDRYAENRYRTSPSIDPKGPITGEKRVLRGGSFGHYFPTNCHVAYRGCSLPSARENSYGFRCARDAK